MLASETNSVTDETTLLTRVRFNLQLLKCGRGLVLRTLRNLFLEKTVSKIHCVSAERIHFGRVFDFISAKLCFFSPSMALFRFCRSG